MANYTIRHEGQDHGPYTPEALKTYVAAGNIRPTDLWRCAPDEPWQPISALNLTPTPAHRPSTISTPVKLLAAIVGIPCLLVIICGTWPTTTAQPTISPEQQAQIDKHGEMNTGLAEFVIERHLKETVNDPESVKIYRMSRLYRDPQGWVIDAEWGARNSFGGMVRQTTRFTLSQKEVITSGPSE